MTESVENAIQTLMKLEQAFTEPDFICEIEDLLNKNLYNFIDGEQTHECYEIFLEFSRKIENKLEQFASNNSIAEEQLFEYCKAVYEQDSHAMTCFEYILSACDYNDFLQMMITRKNIQEWSQSNE